MRSLDQLLLVASLIPLGAMVLLLLAAFRIPRSRPRADRARSRP